MVSNEGRTGWMKSLLRVENRVGQGGVRQMNSVWHKYQPPGNTQAGGGIYKILWREVSRETEESSCISTWNLAVLREQIERRAASSNSSRDPPKKAGVWNGGAGDSRHCAWARGCVLWCKACKIRSKQNLCAARQNTSANSTQPFWRVVGYLGEEREKRPRYIEKKPAKEGKK